MKKKMKKNNLETLEKKEKKFEVIVKTIMLILIILVVIFFIYPGMLIKNITNRKINTTVQNTVTQEDIQTDKNNFTEFSEGSLNDKNFIIAKKTDNIWYEIKSSDENLKMIGKYNDKLYYYDESGISYVNIYENELTDKQWLKYRKYKTSDTSEEKNLVIEKAIMIDNTIYFSYSINSTETIEINGILAIKTDDTSLSNAIQILSKADNFYWDIDTNTKEIYYMQEENNLIKYNIQENKTEKILDNIEGFKLYNNEKILYFDLKQNSNEKSVSKIIMGTHDLYLYNIKTQENKEIFSSSVSSIDASKIWQLADYYNNDVYYKMDNNIIKYNNGLNEIIYKYSSESNNSLSGFDCVNENIIEIDIQNENKKYLINGTVFDEIPSNYKTIVKMKEEAECSIIIKN